MRFTFFIFTFFMLFLSGFNCKAQTKSIKKANDLIDVIHYSIFLEDVNFSTKILKANTEITLTPKFDNTNNIQLDLFKYTIDSMLLNATHVQNFTYNDTVINISLQQTINTNDTVTLKIYYRGIPTLEPYQWGGFHIDASYAYNLGVAFEAYPHNFGKAWFPCLDNFTDRATYDYYITVQSSHKAICGGTLISITPINSNYKIYHWKMNNTITTYLASVAIGSYAEILDTFNGINGRIPIGIYVRPVDSLRATTSFTNLKNILSIYENFWGPYRWERVGYVGTTKGAMEHSCNIAYPNSSITGNTTNEWLYAHELSHHWFGDLITCSTQEDMWINEGWATFCESIFREGLYGKQSYKTNIHSKIKDVLYNTYVKDGGYYALYGIPQTLTYGSTVYDKGAVVVHTLRNYIGDTLFFPAIKAFLNTNAYKSVSSFEMRDFLSAYTGINLNDFFDAWVFTPGFPHFSVDSFTVTNISQPLKEVNVFVRQKHLGNNSFANSNKAELTFLGPNWEKYTDTICFSGQTGNKTFFIPFIPTSVILDLDEKIADATVDNYQTIKTIGNKTFPDTYFTLEVSNINDSAFVRAEHNLVPPDSMKNPIEGLLISKSHYWKIDGIFPNNFIAKGKFSYNKYGYEKDIIFNSADSLLVLHRENANQDWHFINFTRTGNNSSGYISVDTLIKGEYTFAIWDWNHYHAINEINSTKKNILTVYPNPSSDSFTIVFNYKSDGFIKILNNSGQALNTIDVNQKQRQIIWKPKTKESAFYIIEFFNNKNQLIETKKIIYSNVK